VAFRESEHVGTRIAQVFAAQWLACVLPCRRFADTLAGADARLGASAVRYSFTVVDLHLLLLAGFTGAPRILDWDPISELHQGQRSDAPHRRAGHMTAPDHIAGTAWKTLARGGRPHMSSATWVDVAGATCRGWSIVFKVTLRIRLHTSEATKAVRSPADIRQEHRRNDTDTKYRSKVKPQDASEVGSRER